MQTPMFWIGDLNDNEMDKRGYRRDGIDKDGRDLFLEIDIDYKNIPVFRLIF